MIDPLKNNPPHDLGGRVHNKKK